MTTNHDPTIISSSMWNSHCELNFLAKMQTIPFGSAFYLLHNRTNCSLLACILYVYCVRMTWYAHFSLLFVWLATNLWACEIRRGFTIYVQYVHVQAKFQSNYRIVGAYKLLYVVWYASNFVGFSLFFSRNYVDNVNYEFWMREFYFQFFIAIKIQFQMKFDLTSVEYYQWSRSKYRINSYLMLHISNVTHQLHYIGY